MDANYFYQAFSNNIEWTHIIITVSNHQQWMSATYFNPFPTTLIFKCKHLIAGL